MCSSARVLDAPISQEHKNCSNQWAISHTEFWPLSWKPTYRSITIPRFSKTIDHHSSHTGSEPPTHFHCRVIAIKTELSRYHMQRTMNMATNNFKSTSGSILLALVVLLVALMVAETSAQLVDYTIVNELDAPLTVTIRATALSPAVTTTIAARSDGLVRVSITGSVLVPAVDFKVRGCVYSTSESIQGSGSSNTGTVQVYVTGHCKTGEPGLQYVVTIEGDVTVNMGCAAPVISSCAGPINWLFYVRCVVTKYNLVIIHLLDHTTSTNGMLLVWRWMSLNAV